jgi:tetratricopeptide (TPR) repeat protein
MDALVSAVAARIVFIEGEEATYIDAETPGTRTRTTLDALPYLLMGAYDVAELKDTSESDAFGCLLRKWNEDRALRMLDIVIDSDEELDTRCEAAGYLSAFLKDTKTLETIKNRAYAIPLDVGASVAEIGDQGSVSDFIDTLLMDQDAIGRIRKCWDEIPSSFFRDADQRRAFEWEAVDKGVFRMFAEAGSDYDAVSAAMFKALSLFRSHHNARQIIREWTKDLSTRPARRRLKRMEAALELESEDIQDEFVESAEHGPIHQKFLDIQSQKQTIRALLEAGNLPKARRFTRELVNSQIADSGFKFAAKTLCDLAQDAKYLGLRSLQLEWVQWAAEIAPEDGWARAQAGDAYLAMWRLDDANREFVAATKLGSAAFGLTGIARLLRARGKLDEALELCRRIKVDCSSDREVSFAWALYSEILREMWRYEEALSSYEDGVKAFPDQSAFLCGQAAVLKDMGRLGEALGLYEQAVRMFGDQVAYGGRADVLKELGNLSNALAAYEVGLKQFPQDLVLSSGRADIFRAMGRFDDALAAYEAVLLRYPFEPNAHTGYASTLWDMGRIADSLTQYDAAVTRFPDDVGCRIGRANALRSVGRFEDALQAFDQNARDFPYNLYSLTARARLLKLLGRYHDALDAFDVVISRRPDYTPAKYSKAAIFGLLKRFDEADALLPNTRPATRMDWVAFHIRGMLLLKQCKVKDAVSLFEEGVRRTPFFRQRQYFENALAAANIRLKKYSEASELVNGADDMISRLLQLHSFAELGYFDKAREAYDAVNDNSPPLVVSLRDELAARYSLANRVRLHNDDWILDQEIEVILQAA